MSRLKEDRYMSPTMDVLQMGHFSTKYISCECNGKLQHCLLLLSQQYGILIFPSGYPQIFFTISLQAFGFFRLNEDNATVLVPIAIKWLEMINRINQNIYYLEKPCKGIYCSKMTNLLPL